MTTSTEGWICWSGGECAVNEKAVVDIRLSNGRVIHQTQAGRWLWSRPRNEMAGLDAVEPRALGIIVAYREAEECV